MTDPVLVEVIRGKLVESRHRGAVALIDGEGRSVLSAGDVERPVFPRSAVKVFQAIPLVTSGAADAFGFGKRELSLACASHSGEPGHVALAGSMLERAGIGEAALECGCHWPFDLSVALDLARGGGQPTPLHNNCSGKHAGFLATAMHQKEDPAGYVGAGHPAQRRVKAAIEELTGVRLGSDVCGTDGCLIPTYAGPLQSFALGFAKLATGQAVSADMAKAGRRLIAACMAEPWFMAGTKRACTRLMEAAPGRIFVKTGAEGVYCGAVPELGLGFALKVDDGATRAAEILTAATLARCFEDSDPELAERFTAMARRTIRNWNEVETGEIRSVM